ncbi:MAG: hypothetical protein DHS20C17_06540 [Cyclobacteriaceae bacterium]|nr:MAG: hypothetical protein DHS20C17_06540 [Cyclobacteriaceae bacterium]
MLTHQVYFWLKDPKSSEARTKLLKGLHSLLTIENISSGHIGTPAVTAARDVVDHSFTFAYYTTFDSVKDHEIYQTHPVHLKFVEECGSLWEKVQVYDYSRTD